VQIVNIGAMHFNADLESYNHVHSVTVYFWLRWVRAQYQAAQENMTSALLS